MGTCCFWKSVGNTMRRQEAEKGSCGVRAIHAIIVHCHQQVDWQQLKLFDAIPLAFAKSSDKKFVPASAFGCCAAGEAEVSKPMLYLGRPSSFVVPFTWWSLDCHPNSDPFLKLSRLGKSSLLLLGKPLNHFSSNFNFLWLLLCKWENCSSLWAKQWSSS